MTGRNQSGAKLVDVALVRFGALTGSVVAIGEETVTTGMLYIERSAPNSHSYRISRARGDGKDHFRDRPPYSSAFMTLSTLHDYLLDLIKVAEEAQEVIVRAVKDRQLQIKKDSRRPAGDA